MAETPPAHGVILVQMSNEPSFDQDEKPDPADNGRLDPACLGDQSFEEALEPHHLIRRADAVLRAGTLMLGAGTSSLRVRELMRRSAAALGLDQLHTSIGFTSIILTVQRGQIFRTQIGETGTPGVNAHRIAMLQQFSLDTPERLTATELNIHLDQIEQTKPLYPTWLLSLLVGLACASVTLLNGGWWREASAVAPAAALAYALQRLLHRHQFNHLAVILVAAATASGGFIGLSNLLDVILGASSPRAAVGFICACLFLIPGFPLVTAGLDLTRLDLSAGIPRIMYAAMVLLSISIGVWIVANLAGVSPDPAPPLSDPGPLVWTVWVLASFTAVVGWAMMFNSPWQVAIAAGGVAMVANVVRLLLLEADVVRHVATFVACVIVGLACAGVGRLFNLEKIIMTVPTLLVMIPGFSALQTMLYFDQADVVRAVSSGISTILVVIAMVAGLATARMLTDPEWTFTRPDAPSLVTAVRRRARRVPLRRRNG